MDLLTNRSHIHHMSNKCHEMNGNHLYSIIAFCTTVSNSKQSL